MLTVAREFVIKHKATFQKAIIAFASILPEPTKDNTLEPNSLILLEKRDKFFRYYKFPNRIELYNAVWKILIDEYEHDPQPRNIFQWLLEELIEEVLSGRWKPRPSGHPSGLWGEPRPYGLYSGREFKNKIEASGEG